MIFVTPLITTIKWRQSDLGAEIVLLSIFRAFELVPTARRQLLHPVISKWAELPPRRHLSTYYNQKLPQTANCLVFSSSLLAITFLRLKKGSEKWKKRSMGEFGYSTLPRTGYSWCVLFLQKAQPLSLWHSSNRLGRPPPPQDSPARTSGMSVRPRLTALTECANLAAELQKCIVEASSNHLRCKDKEYVWFTLRPCSGVAWVASWNGYKCNTRTSGGVLHTLLSCWNSIGGRSSCNAVTTLWGGAGIFLTATCVLLCQCPVGC